MHKGKDEEESNECKGFQKKMSSYDQILKICRCKKKLIKIQKILELNILLKVGIHSTTIHNKAKQD